MTKGSAVRVAFEEEQTHAEARSGPHDEAGPRMRWYYGRLSRVHRGGELVDVKFDNGETAEQVPLFHVKLAAVSFAAEGDAAEGLGGTDAFKHAVETQTDLVFCCTDAHTDAFKHAVETQTDLVFC